MLGDLISAGVNLFQGQANRDAQQQQNQIQMQIAQQNMALQREFAQSGIQWKVADAIKAGLHPLAALGAQTSSFSPVSVGGEAAKTDFGSMGQDLSRAIKAAMSNNDRAEADAAEATRLGLEKGRLENDILRTELASKQKRMETNGASVAMPANTSVLARVPLPRPGPARTVSEGAAVSDDDIKQKTEDYPQTKIVRPWGYPLQSNPWFSDGQQFEDRYGEGGPLSWLKGAANTIADHAYTGWNWINTDPYAGQRKPRRRLRPWGN